MPRYSEQLNSLVRTTPHAGTLPVAMKEQLAITVGNAIEGQLLTIYVQKTKNNSLIARFQAKGSITLIAGGELLCQLLETNSLSELSKIEVNDFLERLELSTFYRHTAYLLHKALQQILTQSAISDEFHQD
jgi:hypothetical protein